MEFHPIPKIRDIHDLKESLGQVRGRDAIISEAARGLHTGTELVRPFCPSSICSGGILACDKIVDQGARKLLTLIRIFLDYHHCCIQGEEAQEPPARGDTRGAIVFKRCLLFQFFYRDCDLILVFFMLLDKLLYSLPKLFLTHFRFLVF